jgi:hypothetical protein
MTSPRRASAARWPIPSGALSAAASATSIGCRAPEADATPPVLPRRGRVRAALVTARPAQWIKNGLLIAAAGAAGALGHDDVRWFVLVVLGVEPGDCAIVRSRASPVSSRRSRRRRWKWRSRRRRSSFARGRLGQAPAIAGLVAGPDDARVAGDRLGGRAPRPSQRPRPNISAHARPATCMNLSPSMISSGAPPRPSVTTRP